MSQQNNKKKNVATLFLKSWTNETVLLILCSLQPLLLSQLSLFASCYKCWTIPKQKIPNKRWRMSSYNSAESSRKLRPLLQGLFVGTIFNFLFCLVFFFFGFHTQIWFPPFFFFSKCRASITWVIGEYVHKVPKIAPDILRKLAKTFANEDDSGNPFFFFVLLWHFVRFKWNINFRSFFKKKIKIKI